MPHKSSKGDRLIRREPSIDFSNDLAEDEVGTDHASRADEKEYDANRNLSSHLVPQTIGGWRTHFPDLPFSAIEGAPSFRVVGGRVGWHKTQPAFSE
jgi:hypothetical protein